MPASGAFALASLFLLLTLVTRALSLGASNWTLVWRDDFNGPKGSPPSSVNWLYDIGQGCWGTDEIEMMTNSTQNCFLDGKGNLIIAGLRDQEDNWTSARIGAR